LITGPNSKEVSYSYLEEADEQVINQIRRSTSSIRHLPEQQRQAAVSAYAHALHVVFIVNLVWSVLAVGGVFIMKDESMPEIGHPVAREEEEDRQEA
jgi:hypothetical protein